MVERGRELCRDTTINVMTFRTCEVSRIEIPVSLQREKIGS